MHIKYIVALCATLIIIPGDRRPFDSISSYCSLPLAARTWWLVGPGVLCHSTCIRGPKPHQATIIRVQWLTATQKKKVLVGAQHTNAHYTPRCLSASYCAAAGSLNFLSIWWEVYTRSTWCFLWLHVTTLVLWCGFWCILTMLEYRPKITRCCSSNTLLGTLAMAIRLINI